MCINQRRLKTRYMKRPFYVNCGHCPSCLQHKAASRVYRIRNHKTDDKVCLMVTLTYSRGTSPYVDRQEAYQFANGELNQLNVYRDCKIRKVRKPKDYNSYYQVYRKTSKRVVLDTIDFVTDTSFLGTKDMKYEPGKISVNYYKDYQAFAARYRLNLKRHYKYEKSVSMYACSEYGSTSDRSHFHILLFGDKSDKETLRAAVYESWPFSDLRRFPRAVEEAFRASSYVASYVNSRSGFSPFLARYFRPRHSYSKGFGVSSERFSLFSVLSAYEKGSLSFNVLKVRDGFNHTFSVPFPKYVINRFFPLFKGHNTCTTRQAMESAIRISEFGENEISNDDWIVHTNCLGFEDKFLHLGNTNYSTDDLHKISVRLNNAFQRFKESVVPDSFVKYQQSFFQYIQLYEKIWTNYKSTILRLHMENMEIPLLEKYDNFDEVLLRGKPVVGIPLDSIKETDPNKYLSNILDDLKYSEAYRDNIKHRNISNMIYHSQQSACEL